MILYLMLQNVLFGETVHANGLPENSFVLELISKIRILSHTYRLLCKRALITYLVLQRGGIVFHRRLESIYIRDCMTSLTIRINFSQHLQNILTSTLLEDTRRIEGVMCDNDVLLSYRLLRPFEGARCRVSFAAVPMQKQEAINQILLEHGFLGNQHAVTYIRSFFLFITSDEVDMIRLNIAILHYKVNGDNKHICYLEIVMPLMGHSRDLVVFMRKICCDD